MKKPIKLVALAALVLVSGSVLLGAAQGTQTDPLVTLGYLTGVATPKIMKDMDAKLDVREKTLTEKWSAELARYKAEMGKPSTPETPQSATTAAFAVVTVESGKKLIGGVGCEFLLRAGNATCVAASAPGLIDSTDGKTLATGGALVQNHLYMSTAEGRGLLATSAVTVLVRGTYTIA